MSTLINSYEVIDKAPAAHHLDTKMIEPFLKDPEYDLMSKECFSESFYLALINDLRSFDLFDECTVYGVGKVVAYGAQYYIVTTQGPAGTLPTDSNFWSLTTKFITAKYQALWDDGCLCEYMMYSVLHYAVIANAVQLAPNGVNRNSSDYSNPADRKDYLELKNDFQNRREKRYMAMDMYLTRVTDSVDNVALYPLYPPNESGCADYCAPKNNSINIPLSGWKRTRRKCNNCGWWLDVCTC
jgi:hypothetical protein